MFGKLKNIIEHQIIKSENLLEEDNIGQLEIEQFKSECVEIFQEIITTQVDETSVDLAKQGIEYKVKKVKSPLLRWIYNYLTEARDNITFSAPFLKKKSDSDYHKTYVFWTKMRLEGLASHFERTSNEK